jgi:hypothetical protein
MLVKSKLGSSYGGTESTSADNGLFGGSISADTEFDLSNKKLSLLSGYEVMKRLSNITVPARNYEDLIDFNFGIVNKTKKESYTSNLAEIWGLYDEFLDPSNYVCVKVSPFGGIHNRRGSHHSLIDSIDNLLSEYEDDYDDSFKAPTIHAVTEIKRSFSQLVEKYGEHLLPVDFVPDGKGGIEATIKRGSRYFQLIVPGVAESLPYVFRKVGQDYSIERISSSYDLVKWVDWLLKPDLA